MGRVHVKVDARELGGKVIRLGARAKNFDHKLLTALLLEAVEDNFDSEGSKGDDGKWKPHSPNTKRAGGQLLFDTSLLSKWQSRTRAVKGSIVWSPASYAKFHVTGTKSMPKRDPFAIDMKTFMDEAEQLIALEITG